MAGPTSIAMTAMVRAITAANIEQRRRHGRRTTRRVRRATLTSASSSSTLDGGASGTTLRDLAGGVSGRTLFDIAGDVAGTSVLDIATVKWRPRRACALSSNGSVGSGIGLGSVERTICHAVDDDMLLDEPTRGGE